MSDKERFIACYILNTDDTCRTNGNDLVHQLHGVSVRKQLANAVVIHDWCLIGVIDRSLDLMLPNLFPHEAGKLVVDSMSWASSNDTSFNRFTYQSHVADDV